MHSDFARMHLILSGPYILPPQQHIIVPTTGIFIGLFLKHLNHKIYEAGARVRPQQGNWGRWVGRSSIPQIRFGTPSKADAIL
jgi:hypothetical protein